MDMFGPFGVSIVVVVMMDDPYIQLFWFGRNYCYLVA